MLKIPARLSSEMSLFETRSDLDTLGARIWTIWCHLLFGFDDVTQNEQILDCAVYTVNMEKSAMMI